MVALIRGVAKGRESWLKVVKKYSYKINKY